MEDDAEVAAAATTAPCSRRGGLRVSSSFNNSPLFFLHLPLPQQESCHDGLHRDCLYGYADFFILIFSRSRSSFYFPAGWVVDKSAARGCAAGAGATGLREQTGCCFCYYRCCRRWIHPAGQKRTGWLDWSHEIYGLGFLGLFFWEAGWRYWTQSSWVSRINWNTRVHWKLFAVNYLYAVFEIGIIF